MQPGHEYTKPNVAFAEKVEPNNPAVKALVDYCAKNTETQGKFTIGDEKKHNVFMRVQHADVKSATAKEGPVDVMAALREWKNKS